MAYFQSILFWGFVGITSILLFPVACVIKAVTWPFDRRLKALHFFTSLWAAQYTWFSPNWRVRVQGREKVERRATYVIVSNHQSAVDIFALFRIFVHFKWVSKSENFKIPFVGWNMRLNRYIEIARGRVKGNARMMEDCRKTLSAGSSIMIFPEGTRSEDGALRPFRRGAFELAYSTKTPILPVVIEGSARALPKRGVVLRGRHIIQIRILDPVMPDQFGESVDQLLASVQGTIAAEVNSLRQEQSAATGTAS